MRQELIDLKLKLKKEYEDKIALIDQEQDNIIADLNGNVKGVCECKGSGGYVKHNGKNCECQGKGIMIINSQWDPCGRYDRTYAQCAALNPLPKIFKDYGMDI